MLHSFFENVVGSRTLYQRQNMKSFHVLSQLKGISQVQQLDGWDALYLEYQVEWPMGLLLTPQVMARQVASSASLNIIVIIFRVLDVIPTCAKCNPHMRQMTTGTTLFSSS